MRQTNSPFSSRSLINVCIRSEMLDWMSAINAHIHMRYVAEWHITTDFWDRGNVETSFWKV